MLCAHACSLFSHQWLLGAILKVNGKAYKFFDSFSSIEDVEFMMILSSIFDTEWSLGRSISFGAGLTKLNTLINIMKLYVKLRSSLGKLLPDLGGVAYPSSPNNFCTNRCFKSSLTVKEKRVYVRKFAYGN